MPLTVPLRFALPPSIKPTPYDTRVQKLQDYLSRAMKREVEVAVAPSYRDLIQRTQFGTVDVAWSPPFVAARLESSGLKVILRGVRRGASVYRAALLTATPGQTLEWLKGRRAAWVDPYSVSGYLLPLVFLKGKGLEPERDLVQEFAGSFLSAAERVIAGKADVTSTYAPPPGITWRGAHGLEEMAPHLASRLHVLAYTDVVPNSGLVASSKIQADIATAFGNALKALSGAADGPFLSEQLFQMDSFEDAPRTGYHALYRLAVASL